MPIIPEELFKTIRRIQIQTAHLADDVLAGAYRSAFKGQGMEFEEVREFQTGDEVRNIDWHKTANKGFPYVKKFREERDLVVMLVVDISSSSRFGSTDHVKSDLITEIAATLAFSAIKNNDKVGLLLFADQVELFLSPKKGTRHVLRLIRELLVTPQLNKKTNLNAALAYLDKVQRRRCVCFIISDFICNDDFNRVLTLLSKEHDVIAMSVTDPYEAVFPAIKLAHLQDLESGKSLVVDTSSPLAQKKYREAAEKRLSDLKKMMGKLGGGFVDIRTNQHYLETLKKFFKGRARRRR